VIVNWNSGDCLGRLLASLEPLLPELRSVIVVDNNSGDRSQEPAAGLDPVILHRFSSNRGFAAAANFGIEQAKSRFILLLNPDVEIRPPAIRQLYRRAEAMPRLAIACGRLVNLDGSGQEAFQLRPLPRFWSVFSDALFFDEISRILFRRARTSPPQSLQAQLGIPVEQPAAAFWLLRTEAWATLGGFDESFFPAWFEDVDFCKRLRATDWEIRFFPDLECVHRGGISLSVMDYSDFIRCYYANELRYLKKHHPAWYPFLWLPVQLGSWIRILIGGK